MKYIFIFLALLAFLLPSDVFALSPIGRDDVVPYQTIQNGGSFKFGVVAFSETLTNVSFAISGAGYTGTTKTASNMTPNDRTGLVEYWVTISASEFTQNSSFTVTATINSTSEGTRVLSPVTMYVYGASPADPDEIWMATTGNDLTGVVNDSGHPFLTIDGAVAALQAIDGSCSGDFIYMQAGTYSLGSTTPVAATEYLTIKAASGVANTDVIINQPGQTDNARVHFDGITFNKSTGTNYLIDSSTPSAIWASNCRFIGADRWIIDSVPFNSSKLHITDSYIYNVGRALQIGGLARGITIERVGEDVAQNVPYRMFNITVDDQDPGTTYWHADGYQGWGDGADNRILYNVKITNSHYQGFFMRASTSDATDNAIVNCYVEMAEPGRYDRAGGKIQLTSGAMTGNWDHTYFVGNTFAYKNWSVYADDTSGLFSMTNSYVVGNHFYQFVDSYTKTSSSVEPSYTQHGNAQGNVFLYNSYEYARSVQGTPCYWDTTTPHCYSKAFDSGVSATGDSRIVGDPLLDSSGVPQASSPLVDYYPSVLDYDIDGNLRGPTSTVGAYEYTPGTSDTDPPTMNSIYPSSPLASGTTGVTITFGTSETSNCKYGSAAPSGSTGAEKYTNLPSSFTQNPGSSFSLAITGLTDGSSTSRYVVCCDDESTPNCMADATVITAEVLTATDTCENEDQYCTNPTDCSTYYPTNNWCPGETPACKSTACANSCGAGANLGYCDETSCGTESLYWYNNHCYDKPFPSLAEGSDLLTNGDFSDWPAGQRLPTSWSQYNGSAYVENFNGSLHVYNGGNIYQSVLEPNTAYVAIVNVREIGAGQGIMWTYPTDYFLSELGTNIINFTTSAVTGHPELFFQAATANDIMGDDILLFKRATRSGLVTGGGSGIIGSGGTGEIR